MKRVIYASKETEFMAEASTSKKVKVFGIYPVDKADCPCQEHSIKWKNKLAMANEKERRALLATQSHITCPRDKTGMDYYEVSCRKCGEVQGYCWATDKTLKDWCDFHYVQWSDGQSWHGCFTPHISPITQELCFECSCGNDTRDFRANMTLPEKRSIELEEKNSVGRAFGKSDSKFIARKIKPEMVK